MSAIKSISATDILSKVPFLAGIFPGPPSRLSVLNDKKAINQLLIIAKPYMAEQSFNWLESYIEVIAEHDERPDIAYTVAAYALAGYLPENAYDRAVYERYYIQLEDPSYDLKIKSLDGVDAYYALIKPFKPSHFILHELAIRAVRKNPIEEVSLVTVNDELPFPWEVIDAYIHASGKVTELHFLAQSQLYKHSGHILTHACHCHSRSASLVHGGKIEFWPEHIVHEISGEATESKEARINARLDYLVHSNFVHGMMELMLMFMGFPSGIPHSRNYPLAKDANLLRRVFTLNPNVSPDFAL